ncbi:hypothetical protein [Pseudoxanthomonas sp. UTMC 1351]|uniref:hypothetical protein n=1 Tax=Pseudoxanthomonas sp. UTMC 1351 TaxID=2695853 RepID=UPI0034CFF37D
MPNIPSIFNVPNIVNTSVTQISSVSAETINHSVISQAFVSATNAAKSPCRAHTGAPRPLSGTWTRASASVEATTAANPHDSVVLATLQSLLATIEIDRGDGDAACSTWNRHGVSDANWSPLTDAQKAALRWHWMTDIERIRYDSAAEYSRIWGVRNAVVCHYVTVCGNLTSQGVGLLAKVRD